jgi:MFS transporter, ACS family, hexuronate transporter
LLWLPTYLVQKGITTTSDVGKSIWIPYVAAAAGALVGGAASDRLIHLTSKTIPSRLRVMLIAVLFMPTGWFILQLHSLAGTLAILCVVLAGHMAWKTNLAALTADCFPKRVVGRVESIFSMGSGLGGVLFFAYVGLVVGRYSYAPILIVLGILHPCAYLLLWVTMRRQASEIYPTKPSAVFREAV